MALEVTSLPALKDNYIHMIFDEKTGQTACVDPGEYEPVARYLKETGRLLGTIFLTHHHPDHTQGVKELLEQNHGAPPQVLGFRGDSHRLEGVSLPTDDHQTISWAQQPVTLLHTPGHTLGGVCWWFPKAHLLFTGDTLFGMGCGRLFEGDPKTMWESLKKILEPG